MVGRENFYYTDISRPGAIHLDTRHQGNFHPDTLPPRPGDSPPGNCHPDSCHADTCHLDTLRHRHAPLDPGTHKSGKLSRWKLLWWRVSRWILPGWLTTVYQPLSRSAKFSRPLLNFTPFFGPRENSRNRHVWDIFATYHSWNIYLNYRISDNDTQPLSPMRLNGHLRSRISCENRHIQV